MKKKMMLIICVIIAALSTFLASVSAYASFPFLAYQPKTPKSLIK